MQIGISIKQRQVISHKVHRNGFEWLLLPESVMPEDCIAA